MKRGKRMNVAALSQTLNELKDKISELEIAISGEGEAPQDIQEEQPTTEMEQGTMPTNKAKVIEEEEGQMPDYIRRFAGIG